jgi:hypothetical protein
LNIYHHGDKVLDIQSIRDGLEADRCKRWVCAGDFNSHHSLWDGNEREPMGSWREVKELIELGQLMIEPGTPTWRGGQNHRSSTIDLVIASNTATISVAETASDLYTGSGHETLCWEIGKSSAKEVKRMQVPRWKIRQPIKNQDINEEEIWCKEWNRRVQQNNDSISKSPLGLIPLFKSFLDDIFGQKRWSPQAKRWWTKELEEERDILAEARRTSSSTEQFKLARNRWLRAIRKAKRECWEQFLEASDPATIWKSINSKPQPCAMPLILTSPSGEQYKTIEEKMQAIANISFPKKPDYNNNSTQTVSGLSNSLENQNIGDKERFQVCPKLLKHLLSKTSNSSAPGLDGIGWQELKIWYLIDSVGLCELINYLITTGLPHDLKLARVVVITKPGKRDRTNVKSYWCISLLPTITKLVEKAITLHLSIQGELKGWWHSGQHGSRAGKNTIDALLWLIRKVRENRNKKKHTALVMVDVAAAFPNTSRSEIRHTLRNADPDIAHWVDQWLADRNITMELDGHQGRIRDAGSGIPQGSPLSPVLFGLTCGRILKELPDGCSYVDDCAWTIEFDNLTDKNELDSKVRRLLDQAQSVFRKHGMELDEKKTEIAVIYKANQKRKKWENEANRWTMQWNEWTMKFNRGSTRWLGFYLDRCLNWKAHVDNCVQRGLWKQQYVRRFMAAYGINRKLARTVAWSTTMAIATYGMEVIYEGQQWIVDKIQTVNVRIAKDIAELKATTAGCDAIRSADIPPTQAMLDRRTEHHFLRLISQKNTNSDLIPDDAEDILDEEDLPVLDHWTERAAYDLWTLGDEVETSTPTMIEFAPWHE